jgi:hypothetical protein
MIMLFWETIQCNKRFRTFIVDTDRGHDFVILILFYAIEYRTDPSKQGIVRMCVFVLQTLSVEPNFGPRLNLSFERQEALPTALKIENWSGTFGDFLITVSFMTQGSAHQTKLHSPYTPLSPAAKESLMPYIQHYLRLSITLHLISMA